MHLLRSLVLVLAVGPLAAQSRLVRDAEVRATPDGSIVATLRAGTTWRTGAVRGGFTAVTIEAWVDGARVAGRRESFPESIGGNGTLRLRADPSLNGRILGNFEAGAGVRVVERRGNWARVQREAWILSSALTAATPERPVASAPRPADPRPRAPEVAREAPATPPARSATRDGGLRATRASTLYAAPGAAAVGRVDSGSVVEPLGRDRGWVRVRVDAWLPESLLVPTDSSYRTEVTAADLRLDPAAYRGRLVRWQVQVVGLQTADPLRRDLQPEEPYLLAIGPEGENAVLYLAVPPSLMSQARALASMAKVLITGRVRSARSEPTGAPVLDLLTITKR